MKNRRPSWHDPTVETNPLLTALAELRHVTCRAEFTVPYTKRPGSQAALKAIKTAIDDWAECEMGHREFFWGRPHSAGCAHS
jgi:hypothetical protein